MLVLKGWHEHIDLYTRASLANISPNQASVYVQFRRK